MNYENKFNWTLGQNKPKTNPILSAAGGFRKAKMNLKLFAGKSGHTLPGCSWRTTLYLVAKKVTIYQSIQRFLLTEAMAASVKLQIYRYLLERIRE